MFGPLAMRSTQPRLPQGHEVAVEVDADVADVPGVARRARVQLAAEHQAAADAGRHHHAQRVVVPAGRALPVLGRGHRDAVAGEHDGQPAGPLADPRDQREVAPAGRC